MWHTILYDECAARRAAEVSIQPTGQEADMLFFRDRRIGFHASLYEGTIGRYEAGLPRLFWPMVFDIISGTDITA